MTTCMNFCIDLSFIVGMSSGLILPLVFGIITLSMGWALNLINELCFNPSSNMYFSFTLDKYIKRLYSSTYPLRSDFICLYSIFAMFAMALPGTVPWSALLSLSDTVAATFFLWITELFAPFEVDQIWKAGCAHFRTSRVSIFVSLFNEDILIYFANRSPSTPGVDRP